MKEENPTNLLYMQYLLPKHFKKIFNALLQFSTSQQPFKSLSRHLNLQSHRVVSVIVFSSISMFINNNLKISLEISTFLISPAKNRNRFARNIVPRR